LREHRTDLARKRAIEEAAVKPSKRKDIKVLNGDFRLVLRDLADSSIDLILTDPPYDKKSLPLWGEMAKLAARVLKPGGKMVAMSGQEFLPEVFQQIGKYALQWGWEWHIHFDGPTQSHPSRGILSCGRPILVYIKLDGKTKRQRWLGRPGKDLVVSKGVDHTFHPYGQKVEVYEKLLFQFSKAGDVVLDPFGGGGTVACACKKLGRKCVTTEIKRKYFVTIHKRIFGRPPGKK
jgi:16S rRNA G966 N2-methylase RsmD